MKQVMITYGGTAITIMVMSAVLLFMSSLIFGGDAYGGSLGENETSSGGLLGILAEESIGNKNAAGVGESFSSYKERELPEIIFLEGYEIETGVYIPVENCFLATDKDGKAVLVEVTDITGLQEENLSTVNNENRECFYFEVPGVYQVYVKATDRENRTGYAMVKIPVNKGADN